MRARCAVCEQLVGLSVSRDRDSQLGEHQAAGQVCPGSRRSVVGSRVIALAAERSTGSAGAGAGGGVVVMFPHPALTGYRGGGPGVAA